MTRAFRRFAEWILIAGILMLSGCTNAVLLFPSTDPRRTDGAVRQVIPFNGGELEAWTKPSGALAAGAQPGAYVLCFTGNGSRAEIVSGYQAMVWGNEPVEIWAVNYPGYGGSTPPADIKVIGPAALAAYDYLAQRGKPIVVTGQSLGCVAALHVSARRPVAGVLVQSPPPLRQLIMGNFGWWNLWLLATPVSWGVPEDLDSIANAKATHCRGVFIKTGQDQTVPIKYQEMVEAAYGGPKSAVLLPESGHNDPIDEEHLEIERSMLHALWSPSAAATVQSTP